MHPIQGGRGRRLLTVKEVAAELGVAVSSVYKLCAQGAVPHVRVLGAIRVAPADLAAYVAAQKRRLR